MKAPLFAAALLVAGTAAPGLASTANPFALYTFDTTLTTDDSGNGNTATQQGGTSLAVGQGRGGTDALMVTPTGGVTGLHTGININKSNMASMTMGAWIMANSFGSGIGGKILSDDNGAFGRTIGFDSRGNEAGESNTDIGAFSGTGVVDAEGTGLLRRWMHVAVVYDGTSSGLYIDGVLNEAFTDATSTKASLTGGLVIGANDFFNEEFHGLIDDAFVFDRALNRTEIADIYANGFTTAQVPLPASLPMLLAGLGGVALLRRKRSA